VQDDAIIFTAVTFNFGALADASPAFSAPVADRLSTIPVISTLWPTCGESFESSPSRLYELAVALAAPVVPAVPAAPADVLGVTLFRTNFAAADDAPAAAPVVPVGAAALALARSRHPVSVTVFWASALRCIPADDVVGACGGVVGC
jgi:hypothetical protein